jgi:hypothetical protein
MSHNLAETILANVCKTGMNRPSKVNYDVLSLLSYSKFIHVCLFVVYLTTLFQYLRLYSVDFYLILIRLPSSSKEGETRVRNMAAEFCRRVPIVLVGFFNMPYIYDMGPTALLPRPKEGVLRILSPLKSIVLGRV